MKDNPSPYINKEKQTIEFYIQNDIAGQISLAGSFNHWAQDILLFEPLRNGMWKLELPMLNDGRYPFYSFKTKSYAGHNCNNHINHARSIYFGRYAVRLFFSCKGITKNRRRRSWLLHRLPHHHYSGLYCVLAGAAA